MYQLYLNKYGKKENKGNEIVAFKKKIPNKQINKEKETFTPTYTKLNSIKKCMYVSVKPPTSAR